MSFWIELKMDNEMVEQDAAMFHDKNNSLKRFFTFSGRRNWRTHRWRYSITNKRINLNLCICYELARRNGCRRKPSNRADCKLTYLFFNLCTNGKSSEYCRENILSQTVYCMYLCKASIPRKWIENDLARWKAVRHQHRGR